MKDAFVALWALRAFLVDIGAMPRVDPPPPPPAEWLHQWSSRASPPSDADLRDWIANRRVRACSAPVWLNPIVTMGKNGSYSSEYDAQALARCAAAGAQRPTAAELAEARRHFAHRRALADYKAFLDLRHLVSR